MAAGDPGDFDAYGMSDHYEDEDRWLDASYEDRTDESLFDVGHGVFDEYEVCDGHTDDDFALTSGIGIGEAYYCPNNECVKG